MSETTGSRLMWGGGVFGDYGVCFCVKDCSVEGFSVGG